MVEIKLDKKERDEHTKYYHIEIANETYEENFQLVTYDIRYKTPYNYWLVWIKQSFNLYLKPSSSGNAIYTYYVSYNSDVVDQVKVYYSNLHPTIPLIIGIKTKNGIKYYTYKFLIDSKSSDGPPSTEYFDEPELDQKLKEEHNRRNKLVFRLQDKSHNYKLNIYQELGNFLQYKYSVNETNYNEPFLFSTDKLFELENNISLDSIFFSSLNVRSFDFISVFYDQTNIALFVEFECDSYATYFRRKDKDGYYWEPFKERNFDMMNLPSKLEEIQRDCQNRVSYQLKNTYNDSKYTANRIKVDKHDMIEYIKYSHTPQPSYKTKKSNVLFNGMLIQLEKNADLSVSLLDKIQDSVYSIIFAYAMESPKTELPYILELQRNSVKYYLQRMDVSGKKWRQMDKSNFNPFSDAVNRNAIINEVNYYSKNLLIILISNNGINKDSYIPELIENSSSLGLAPEKPSSKITVKQGSKLSGSIYKHCIHDFSQIISSNGPDGPNYDISGLRLFISGTSGVDSTSDFNDSIELMTYDPDGTKREYLEYKTSERNEDHNKVYVYFYGSDNVPLLVYYNKKWFFAKSKDDYFKKWVKVLSLNNVTPESTQKYTQIKTQLDYINKELNQIQINITSGNYGLDKDNKTTVSKFDSTRIIVEKKGTNYIKLIHTTKNKGPIGKVVFGSFELSDNTNQPISRSSSIYNRVLVHYHKTDYSYKFPLLIGMGTDNTTTRVFYERVDGTKNTKWERVADTSKIQQDGPGLTYKVNHIYYKITKSVKIQMEKKAAYEYEVKYIENGSISGSSSPDSVGSKINVYECSKELSESLYRCCKHTIVLNSGTGLSDIGGIRMFFYDIEIVTFDSSLPDTSPIFYDNLVNDVHIYFYGTSDVPLLFEYNGKYYGPISRDQYFEKWILLRFNTGQLSSNLETINSTLNEINFSHTKNRSFYGIPHPSNKPSDLNDDFYHRIKVDACKNTSYRKVTHTTLNKLPIKNIVYNGKPIKGIQHQRAENQVCVYYDPTDFYFTKPLLIKVCSSIGSSVYESYSRTNIHGTVWKKVSLNYDSDSKLRTELKSIQSRCFFPLNVIIEKQENYNNIVSNDKQQDHTAQINIDKLNIRGGIKVPGYRCFQHELYNYYQYYNGAIKSHLAITEELTFELVLSISGEKIHLCDKTENIIPILTYGNSEGLKGQSLYVYFYDIEDYTNTDSVPLLIYYKDSFYGPDCKDSYFDKWKLINELQGVTSNYGPNRLSPQLDKITLLLNEVDLSKKGDYGIPYCGKVTSKKGNYYENNGFSSKRIDVYNYKNTNYIMRIHCPVNKYKIGNIKSIGSQSFDKHLNQLDSQFIDQIAVVFEVPHMSIPKLILLNSKGFGGFHTTYGYYYDTNSIRGRQMNYEFFHLSGFYDLIESLKKGNKEYIESPNNFLTNITELLNKVTKSEMNEIPKTPDSEVTNCKDKDSESGIDQCPEIEPPPPPEPARPPSPTQSNGKSSLVSQVSSPQQKVKPPGVETAEHLHPQIPLQPLPSSPLEISDTAEEVPGSSATVQVDEGSQRTLESGKGEQISGSPSYPSGGSLHQGQSLLPDGHTESKSNTPPKTPEMPKHIPPTSTSSLDQELSSEDSSAHADATDQYQETGHHSDKKDAFPDREDQRDLSASGFSGQSLPSLVQSERLPSRDGNSSTVSSGSGSTSTQTSEEQTTLDQIKDYIMNHPDVVGGASGGVATVAGGSYPLYKYVFRCKK